MVGPTIEPARIAADGMPDEVLRSTLHGRFALARNGDATVLVMADMTTDRLEAALKGPCRGFVEFRPDDETLSERVALAQSCGDLCLVLTTPTAFSTVDCARLVCEALDGRGILPADQRPGVELALHETVANAILHGNLGMKNDLSADSELYEAFCGRLRDLLDSPTAHRRWICIAATWTTGPDLELLVDDEGAGFDAPARVGTTDDLAPSGRGLSIVHALATEVRVSKGGRCTALRFAYER